MSAERRPRHVPVLAGRSVELLRPSIEATATPVMIDGTLGLGGHSELFLSTFPTLHVIAIDRDERALQLAGERLAPFGDRVTLVHARYDEVGAALAAGRVDRVDAALYDLGVSSMQLDEADRGFAYSVDAPLDMRMTAGQALTAADVLNTYGHGELARVLSEYGEERFAGKIAAAVLREREREPFSRSGRLVELLYRVIPAATRRTGGHPAKRTFQALRIEVNRELESLHAAVPAVLDALAVGGRAVFLSYQSLEDRIVKREFTVRARSSSPEGLPVDLPGTAPLFRVVTRGAERASEAEQRVNPRSIPVRARAIERIAEQGE